MVWRARIGGHRKEFTLGDSADQQGSRRRVAIIGSGPGGLVAARYLKQHGFEPVVFEQDHEIGGQWNVRSPHSGIWPSMVTNTSRLLTCFSDLAPEPGTPIFPSNVEILAYLKRYARAFDLPFQVRFGTRVELVERDPDGGGWLIRSDGTEKGANNFRMSLLLQVDSTSLWFHRCRGSNRFPVRVACSTVSNIRIQTVSATSECSWWVVPLALWK